MISQQEATLKSFRRQVERDGITVTYRRDASSILVEAVLGRQLMQVRTADGVSIRHTDQDFLFEATELGDFETPELGDEIDVVRGSETHTYIAGVQGADDFWRYSDPSNQIVRLHTKHKKTV